MARREAEIVATYLEFAARQYTKAVSSRAVDDYLAGFRYYESAQMRFQDKRALIAAESSGAATAIAEALTLFAQAYRSPGRPATLTADPVALNAAAARVRAAVAAIA